MANVTLRDRIYDIPQISEMALMPLGKLVAAPLMPKDMKNTGSTAYKQWQAAYLKNLENSANHHHLAYVITQLIPNCPPNIATYRVLITEQGQEIIFTLGITVAELISLFDQLSPLMNSQGDASKELIAKYSQAEEQVAPEPEPISEVPVAPEKSSRRGQGFAPKAPEAPVVIPSIDLGDEELVSPRSLQ